MESDRNNTKCNNLIKRILFIFFGIIPATIFGEGSKEINPTVAANDAQWADKVVVMQLHDSPGRPRPFMAYNATENERLNFRICDITETVYMGFQYSTGFQEKTNKDNYGAKVVYYRVIAPDGSVAIPPTLVPTSGNGFIKNFAECSNGPNTFAIGGYAPITFNPTMVGDYYIEFNPYDPNTLVEEKTFITLLDVTITDINDDLKTGRLWSKEWDLNCRSFANVFRGTMFVYSTDGIVTSIDFNGIQPYGFTISANATGLNDSSDPFTDRKSQKGNQNYAEYQLFLNNPDEDCFPSGTWGTIGDDIKIEGCEPSNRFVKIEASQSGRANVILDLNGIADFQDNTRDRVIKDTLIAGVNYISWDGKDGLGNLVPANTKINLIIDYFNGITHLPLYDVENHENGYIVNLVRPAPSVDQVKNPLIFWDDSEIGGTSEFAGCDAITNNGCHDWKDYFGDVKTINTWWYANRINKKAEWDIGNDILVDANTFKDASENNDSSICATEDKIELFGGVENANGGIWSVATGNGAFDNSRELNTFYNITNEDKTRGFVKLRLISDGAIGECDEASDSMMITIVPPSSADAGGPYQVCSNNSTVQIDADTLNVSKYYWTGSGAFTPDSSALNAFYTLTNQEVIDRSTKIYFNTESTYLCATVTDSAIITVIDGPEITSIDTVYACENNLSIPLTATIARAGGVIWSGGKGTFNNKTSLSPTYKAVQEDIDAGEILLNIESTDNGDCFKATKKLRIIFTKPATVEAGSAITACLGTPSISLNGSVLDFQNNTWPNGGVWSGGENMSSPTNENLNLSYSPSAKEQKKGSFYLFLTSKDNGKCNAVKDSVLITLIKDPIPTAIPDGQNEYTACARNKEIQLDGTVLNASNFTWISVNGGKFVSSAKIEDPVYQFTDDEITSGLTVVVLEIENKNAQCLPQYDTAKIFINPEIETSTKNSIVVCKSNPSLKLTGNVDRADILYWKRTGTEDFLAVFTNKLDYTPTPSEINKGTLSLTFGANWAIDGCLASEQEVIVTFVENPIVEAGIVNSQCANNITGFNLSGSITGTGTTGGYWSGGKGTYSKDTTELKNKYTPSAQEVIDGKVYLSLHSLDSIKCIVVTDSILIEIDPAPQAFAGDTIFMCENNEKVQLNGSFAISGGAQWEKSFGNYDPSRDDLNAIYYPNTTKEVALGEFDLILKTIKNKGCKPTPDTLKIIVTDQPQITVGGPYTVCEDNPTLEISATVSVAQGIIWTATTAANFSTRTDTSHVVYTASPNEILNKKMTLTATSTNNGLCKAVSEKVDVTIITAPSISTGGDLIICGSENSVNLSNTSGSNFGTLRWKSLGTGKFNDVTLLKPTYTFSEADKKLDTLVLVLSTENTNLCNEITDTLLITFSDVPVAFAGKDTTICSNNFPFTLQGKGSKGSWVNSGGTFSDQNSLNSTYTPSAQELTNKKVTLTYKTTISGACAAVEDKVILTLKTAPTLTAGDDIIVCTDKNQISLNGSIKNTTDALWFTTGRGKFNTDNTFKNASTYTFDQKDKEDTLYLYLESLPDAFCSTERDSFMINFVKQPILSAGAKQTLCGDVDTLYLNASLQNLKDIKWSTTGSNPFVDNNSSSSNTAYIPSLADIKKKSIDFIVVSQNTGTCNAVSDTTTIIFTEIPTVFAGNDSTICADADTIDLNGITTFAGSGTWQTNGKGSFDADNFGLIRTYYLNESDRELDTLTFILEGTDIGSCKPVFDTMKIAIASSPSLNLPSSFKICEDSIVVIEAVSSKIGAGVWTNNGSGKMTDSSAFILIYSPSVEDVNIGAVKFTFTSTEQGTCKPLKESTTAQFIKVPTFSAGGDMEICASDDSVKVIGSSKEVKISWSTSISGTFTNPDSTTSYYFPSQAEKDSGIVSLFLHTKSDGICASTFDEAILSIKPLPTLDLGDDQTVCGDSAFLELTAKIQNASGLRWSSVNGGDFNPSNIKDTVFYSLTNTDKLKGEAIIIAETQFSGICAGTSDTVSIFIDAEPSLTLNIENVTCSNNDSILVTAVVERAGNVAWNSSGFGTFTLDTALSTYYHINEADITAKKINISASTVSNGLCKTVSKSHVLNFQSIPTVSTGGDQVVCISGDSVSFSQILANIEDISWTSDGSGIFAPNNFDPNAYYVPSKKDKNLGEIKIALTGQNAGVCSAPSDTMTLRFYSIPSIKAGNDVTICETTSQVELKGTGENITDFIWSSSGTGTFTNAFSANTVYKIGTQDKADSVVTIFFNSSDVGTGPCPSVTDSLQIFVNPLPTIKAIEDFEICSSEEATNLSAIISNAKGVIWSTTGNGTFANDSTINTDYQIDDKDYDQASITFNVSTTGNNQCKSVKDQIIVKIKKEAEISAGPNTIMCTQDADITLSGFVNEADGLLWKTSGTGTFDNENSDAVVYTPSPEDFTLDSLIIGNETVGTGVCKTEYAYMTLKFLDQVKIDAGGPAMYVCTNNIPVRLKGSGANGTWEGGTGTFSPSRTILTPLYTPTKTEFDNDSLMLIIKSAPSIACGVAEDTVMLYFLNGPEIILDTNTLTVCETTTSIEIDGSVNFSDSLVWSSNGKGKITPDKVSNKINYFPTAQDITDSTIVITLTSNTDTECPNESKTKRIHFYPEIELSGGFDQTLCADIKTVELNGETTNASTTQWTKTGDNSGSFNGSENNLEATYDISSTDSLNGEANFILLASGNPFCPEKTDTFKVTLTPAVTLDLGDNLIVCETDLSQVLKADFKIAKSVIWSTNNSGILSSKAADSSATYNKGEDNNLVLVYASTVNNNGCKPLTDSVSIQYEEAPIAETEETFDICGTSDSISITGTVSETNLGFWTSPTKGKFSPDSSNLSAVYFPTSKDVQNESVNLLLTSVSTNSCKGTTSILTVGLIAPPVAAVNAGFNKEICADELSVNLKGEIKGASSAYWITSGGGIITPDTNSLEISYEVNHQKDLSGTSIEFILMTTENGLCPNESDTVYVALTPIPKIDAGSNFTVCSNSDSIQLKVKYTVAKGVKWKTTGLGDFISNKTKDSLYYVPTSSDINQNSIGFTVETVGNGRCQTYDTNFTVTFQTKPQISINKIPEYCDNIDSVEIGSKFTNTKGIVWSNTSLGSFTNDSIANTYYKLSQKDKENGIVTIHLRSIPDSICPSSTEKLSFNINSSPTPSIGLDKNICASQSEIELSVSKLKDERVKWFVNNNFTGDTTYNITYQISESELVSDTLQVIIYTDSSAQCLPESDTMYVKIQQIPDLDIQPGYLCGDVVSFDIHAIVNNAGGVKWSSETNGTFETSIFDKEIRYYPTSEEFEQGFVTLTVISTQNGLCKAQNLTKNMIIHELPNADAGNDQTVCINDSIGILAKIGNNNDYLWTSMSGDTLANEAILNSRITTPKQFALTVTNVFGCTKRDTVQINVITPPTFNFEDYYCFSENLILKAIPNSKEFNGDYQWFRNGDFIFNNNKNKEELIVEESGTHLLKFFYKQCVSGDTTEVKPLPIAEGPDVFACIGSETTIKTTFYENATYDWFNDNKKINNTTFELKATIVDTQIYFINVIDSLGCIGLDTITTFAVEKPELTLETKDFCEGDEVLLSGVATNIQDTINPTFKWFKDNSELQNINDTLSISTAGKYKVIYTIGECSADDSATIAFLPVPKPDNEASAETCFKDGTVLTLDAGNATAWTWGDSVSLNQTLDVIEEGTYYVQIYNEHNCFVVDSVVVTQLCPPEIYIPDGFIPGSGNNDALFKVFGEDMEEVSVTIYNRWGEVIFYTEDQKIGWDGTYRGKDMPSGVYPYLVRYKGKDQFSEQKLIEGGVTLIR